MIRFAISLPIAAVLIGGNALAAPAVPGLTPLPAQIPDKCLPLANTPRSAEIPGPEISSHVSVANCLAEYEMSSVKTAPTDTSIDQMTQATAPAMALLDGVIATGDPYWMIIAQDSKRDLYDSMVVRTRTSIKGVNMAARNKLEPKLSCWQAGAEEASTQVAELRAKYPQVANSDAVIAHSCNAG